MSAESVGVLRLAALGALLLVGAAGFARRRYPHADRLGRFLASATLAFAFLLVAMELLGSGGFLTRTSLDVSIVAFAIVGWWIGRKSPVQVVVNASAVGWSNLGDRMATVASPAMLAVILTLAFGWALVGYVAPVAPVSDGPIYHLPIAIRWALTGTLERVWTPFGELAATYFPANGDLWMTWLFLQTGDDRYARVGQAPFVVLTVIALAGVGRRIGLVPLAPACAFLSVPLVLVTGSLPLVDLTITAWICVTAFFLVEAAFASESQSTRLALAGLAFGAAVGTKATGVLAIPFAALALAAIARKDVRGWLAFAAGAFLTGGYWFARSWWETGNLLYPLHLEIFGRTILAGWYDGRIMRATSNYHIDPWSLANLQSVMKPVAPPPLWALWAGSVLFGLLQVRRRPAAAALAATALVWFVAMWWLVPYNTQQRFVLPALALGMAPLAGVRGWWAALPLGVVGYSLYQSGMLRFVRTEIGMAAFGMTCASVVVAQMRRLPALWCAVVVGAAALAIAEYRKVQDGRTAPPAARFFPEQGFAAELLPAWMTLERAAGNRPAVVAYAGTNLPYYLYGPAFARRPVYVNVNAPVRWLPHDFHRVRLAAGRTDLAPTAWPQWHRENPVFDVWLANLRELRVEYLFVARENYHGRKDSPSGLAPFPIEYRWANDRPDLFERLGPPAGLEESWGVLYRIKPSAESG